MMIYKVFEIDKCFEQYASDTIMVGGESVEDILNHFDEIFPPYIDKVIREDWMSDEDWDECCEYGKYKEGETKVIPQFEEEQLEEFKLSLDPDTYWPRIKEVPHLFTDTPYKHLIGHGYIE